VERVVWRSFLKSRENTMHFKARWTHDPLNSFLCNYILQSCVFKILCFYLALTVLYLYVSIHFTLNIKLIMCIKEDRYKCARIEIYYCSNISSLRPHHHHLHHQNFLPVLDFIRFGRGYLPYRVHPFQWKSSLSRPLHSQFSDGEKNRPTHSHIALHWHKRSSIK